MWPFKKKEIILSNKKYRDYLPVGTIVKLHNDDNEYMIFRYLGNICMPFNYNNKLLAKSHIYNTNKEKSKKYYHVDYAVTPYPFANLSGMLYVMHEDIKDIIYLGYDDEYRKNILNDIDKWKENAGDTNE